MTRSIHSVSALFAPAFALAGVVVLAAGPGCKAGGVGDPCVPEQEYDKSFLGFNEQEVNVESKSFQCQTRLCLVNHFRGRVTCPKGQSRDGVAPGGKPEDACFIPDSKTPIDGLDAEGNQVDPQSGKQVCPQCTDRSADKAVYCSCRCANVDGKTDDGASYCECPEGFECKQLVTSIGAQDTGLTGGYCIKSGTAYDRNNACSTSLAPELSCTRRR